jgi:Cdc6-like AAA superfamily ATPase
VAYAGAIQHGQGRQIDSRNVSSSRSADPGMIEFAQPTRYYPCRLKGGALMLIAFCGLPGTGKTTLARRLARRLQAAYLRIDTVEEVLLAEDGAPLVARGAGYAVAYAVAEDSL